MKLYAYSDNSIPCSCCRLSLLVDDGCCTSCCAPVKKVNVLLFGGDFLSMRIWQITRALSYIKYKIRKEYILNTIFNNIFALHDIEC